MTEKDKVTPWNVSETALNYDKLIMEFGCKKIDDNLIERIEKVTGKPAHHLIRRGLVFAHRDLDQILDRFEKNEPFYLYTGRGPSTKSLHIGHVIPFLLSKYLQDMFDVPLVIQITDDEKFLFKNLDIESTKNFAIENVKDIIAFGFNPEKTFIFSNIDVFDKPKNGDTGLNNFFQRELMLSKEISFNEGSKIFGFDLNSNLGQITFPVRQILPCYFNTFNFLKKCICLVPAALDQDPYFRLARDKSKYFGCDKPACIYSGFLPSLRNLGKMSNSASHTIFLDDSLEEVATKIHKYAFSGGKDTLAEHREFGGDTDKDTAFQYLRYFLEDDTELKTIEMAYRSGKMTSKEMKQRCVEEIQAFIEEFKKRRASINQEIIDGFFSCNKRFY